MQNARLIGFIGLIEMSLSIILGIIPILLFIAWIQGNMTLPGEIHRALIEKFSWPWLHLQESSVSVRIGADVLLLLLLGVLAQLGSKLGTGFFGPRARLILLGAGLFCVMSSWQYTGLIFWGIRLPPTFSQIVFPILYYGFVIAALCLTTPWPDSVHDPFNTLTRESILLLGLAALLTPLMSVDRLIVIVFIGALIYFKCVTRKVKA
jgi:hypothetical protein